MPTPRVLLIEDNPADIRLVRLALEEAGVDCEFTSVQDGRVARDLAVALRQEDTPDVVLLDINLPNLSGFDVLEALRQNPVCDAVPLVVFSSTVNPEEIARARSFGIREFFSKPLTLDGMMEIGPMVKTILGAGAPGGSK